MNTVEKGNGPQTRSLFRQVVTELLLSADATVEAVMPGVPGQQEMAVTMDRDGVWRVGPC